MSRGGDTKMIYIIYILTSRQHTETTLTRLQFTPKIPWEHSRYVKYILNIGFILFYFILFYFILCLKQWHEPEAQVNSKFDTKYLWNTENLSFLQVLALQSPLSIYPFMQHMNIFKKYKYKTFHWLINTTKDCRCVTEILLARHKKLLW